MSPIFGPGQKLRAIGAAMLVATFVAGGVVGAAVQQTVLADETPRQQPAERGRDGDRRTAPQRRDPYEGLGVTAEQRAAIDSVVARGRLEVDAFNKQYGPILEAIRDSTRDAIDRIFTPEQRAELERRRELRRQRYREQQQQREQQRGDQRSGAAEHKYEKRGD
jgi:Spy/CpxP family protein refolding chaperone